MASSAFQPKHLVVLAELDTREKERYFDLLLQHSAKLHRSEGGRFLLNMRLLAPGVKKQMTNKKQKELQASNSLPFEERLERLKDEDNLMPLEVKFADQTEQFDYSSYARFTTLIANDGDTVAPRPKLLSWLMRAIEEIYDARFAHEAAEVGRVESDYVAEQVSNIFPAFVVKRLNTKVGLRSLVDQTCWDLLYNAHIYRRDYLEVEMFCRFLQEFYDHDDLLFFLYVRSVVAKQLHVSFKTRWTKSDGPGRQPKSLWLSYRECVHVAKTVFGDANENMCRDFLSIVQPQMVGRKGGVGSDGKQQPDSRRIDITQFLHLAVVGYHQTRPDENEDDNDGYDFPQDHREQWGDASELKKARPLPAKSPSGGNYMSRYSMQNSPGDGPSLVNTSTPYQTQHEFASNDFSEEDDYLNRLQQDREEILQMQQQGNFFNEYEEDGIENFNDPMLMQDDNGMDLADLATSSPPERSKAQSLADFAKQRKQMDELNNELSRNNEDYEQSQYDENPNEQETISDVQYQREKEFLGMFCDSVYEFPNDVASSIVDELSERLHNKVSSFLNSEEQKRPMGLPQDPDDFDDIVVNYLQSDELQADMAAARDLMLTYVRDRMNQ